MTPTKYFLLSFFTLAFLIKALIPYGFMPNFEIGEKSALTPIVICSGLIEKTVYLNENGEFENDTTQKHSKVSDCAFSIANIFTAHSFNASLIKADLYNLSFIDLDKRSFNQTLIISYQSRAPPFLNA